MERVNSLKRSKHEIKRIVERVVSDEFNFSSQGLWLCVNEVEASGKPIANIRVWATLHFLLEGSPFEDTDTMFVRWISERINDSVGRAFRLRQPVAVDFVLLKANVHDGVVDLEEILMSAEYGCSKDINLRFSGGITPLIYYAAIAPKPKYSTVYTLLCGGADPTLRDEQGLSALDHAKSTEGPDSFQIIKGVTSLPLPSFLEV